MYNPRNCDDRKTKQGVSAQSETQTLHLSIYIMGSGFDRYAIAGCLYARMLLRKLFRLRLAKYVYWKSISCDCII